MFKQLAAGDSNNTGLDDADWWGPLFYRRDTRRMYNVGFGSAKSTSINSAGPWPEDFTYDNADNENKLFGSEIDQTLFLTFWESPSLLVAEHNGGAWVKTSIDFAVGERVSGVYASREHPGECWVGLLSASGDPKLYHTTDPTWQSWDDLTGTLDVVGRVQAVVATPFDPDRIFVGTDIGVFVTSNGGTTWEPFQEGLPIVRCTDLRYLIDPTGIEPHKLIVSTFGRGVYERLIAGTPIVYVDQENRFGLEDGAFERPFDSLQEGRRETPLGGTLALRGGTYSVSAPFTLSDPMTIRAYDGTATIEP